MWFRVIMVGQTIPLSTSAWLCCKVGVGFPKLPAASWTQPQQGPSVPSVEGPVPKTYPWHVEHLHICKPTPTQSWEKMQLFNFHQFPSMIHLIHHDPFYRMVVQDVQVTSETNVRGSGPKWSGHRPGWKAAAWWPQKLSFVPISRNINIL